MLLWALGLAIRHWALAGIRGVLLRIVGGGVLPGSPNPDPTSDQEIPIFHTRFQTWGPFLESPGNFSGPKSNIQIEI